MENQIQQQTVTQPAATTSVTQQKAGFIYRWAAYSLDSLIVSFLGGIVLSIIKAILKADFNVGDYTSIIFIIYSAVMIGRTGATLGKKLFNLKVVDSSSGKQPGWGKAILRESIGKILSAIVLGLGFVWALWDKNKQTWHDKIAGTYVIQTQEVGKGKKVLAYLLSFFLPTLAILGIVAAVILISINPAAQIKKAQETQQLQQQQLQQLQQNQ